MLQSSCVPQSFYYHEWPNLVRSGGPAQSRQTWWERETWWQRRTSWRTVFVTIQNYEDISVDFIASSENQLTLCRLKHETAATIPILGKGISIQWALEHLSGGVLFKLFWGNTWLKKERKCQTAFILTYWHRNFNIMMWVPSSWRLALRNGPE